MKVRHKNTGLEYHCWRFPDGSLMNKNGMILARTRNDYNNEHKISLTLKNYMLPEHISSFEVIEE